MSPRSIYFRLSTSSHLPSFGNYRFLSSSPAPALLSIGSLALTKRIGFWAGDFPEARGTETHHWLFCTSCLADSIVLLKKAQTTAKLTAFPG